MGSKNPIKSIVNAAVGAVTRPFEEVAGAVGLSGISDALSGARRGLSGAVNTGIDLASGKIDQMKKDQKKQAQRAEAEFQAGETEKRRQAQVAENNRIEGERMKVGSGARTLLTGPKGLDEEESITRRTLSGF